ncbi:hypothetical protein [Tropicimonas sp. IMCC6043]|uniref:hypothetical protein n=1 Tax=Tropicimonas sp. IMCC6043 TaxID=2510645 RepID=UPI00101C2413|nr:hypothetical protein [Tropicimonas sp. IMCC6043]RYH06515.1 hypothetical protein EU800_23540 [Tropicimonas sp. IMCC6043]
MEELAWVVGILGALFLLFRFPRPSLIFIGGLVTIGVSVAGFFYVRDQLAKQKAAKVEASVAYDLERCSPEYPLFIGIVNDSADTVEDVSFGVEGHHAAYSDPLYNSGYLGYSSDRIIASGEGWGSCWTLPPQAYGASEQRIAASPPETLVWTVKNVSPTFRER